MPTSFHKGITSVKTNLLNHIDVDSQAEPERAKCADKEKCKPGLFIFEFKDNLKVNPNSYKAKEHTSRDKDQQSATDWREDLESFAKEQKTKNE